MDQAQGEQIGGSRVQDAGQEQDKGQDQNKWCTVSGSRAYTRGVPKYPFSSQHQVETYYLGLLAGGEHIS